MRLQRTLVCLLSGILSTLAVPVGAARSPATSHALIESGQDIHLALLHAPLRLDGQLYDWPPSLQQHSAPGDRSEGLVAVAPGLRLMLAQDPQGIALALASHHLQLPFVLRIEMLGLSALELPAIGWRWRWGPSIAYRSAEDCEQGREAQDTPRYDVADCRRWYAQQERYRSVLASEFVRRFEIRGDGSVVDPDADRSSHLPLRPQALPLAARAREDWLEVLVPWDALPATDSLRLERVLLRAQLCQLREDARTLGSCLSLLGETGDGAFTAPDAGSEADSGPLLAGRFDSLRLSEPRSYRVSPCELPLMGDIRPGLGDLRPGYFLPGLEGTVEALFSLHEPAKGYQDAPDGLSPTVHLSRFTWQTLGEDEHLCFPGPVWRRGATRVAPRPETTEPAPWTSSPPVAVSAVDGDNRLVVRGPYENFSHTGQGQCGGCPWTELHVWYLDRSAGSLLPAFSYRYRDESSEGMVPRITVSPDHREIGIEERACTLQPVAGSPSPADETEAWVEQCSRTLTRWCLAPGARRFEACGHSVQGIERDSDGALP